VGLSDGGEGGRGIIKVIGKEKCGGGKDQQSETKTLQSGCLKTSTMRALANETQAAKSSVNRQKQTQKD